MAFLRQTARQWNVAMLCTIHQPSASVFLIVQGGADVSVAGRKSHRLSAHQFIGDMGLSSGITISQPVRLTTPDPPHNARALHTGRTLKQPRIPHRCAAWLA